jgi:Domain of unknown function (DUF4145)
MIVECPYCDSKVDAKVIGDHTEFSREDPIPFRTTLTVCPSCKQSILAGQYESAGEYGDEWEAASRLWPKPSRVIAWEIPDVVRVSLDEADRCFRATAFTATAVMCGRALEGVCVNHKTKAKTLAQGLEELKDKEIIDKRLYEWGQELRKLRNLGAHASAERVSKDDATDMLDFVHAICDYVYVLNKKFERFKKRRDEDTLEKT